MAKTLFLMIIGLLSLHTTYSQAFVGGILLGITASQVDGDSYAGYDRLGIQGGVYVSYKFLPKLNGRLEIKYASRGARNPADKDNTGSYLLSLHYVDLPLIAAFSIKSYGSIDIGLVPGYRFAAGGKDDAGNLPEEYLVDFRKFDLGTVIGITINLTEKASVSIRYSYSIFSIRDLESAGSYYSWFGKLFGHSRGDFNNYLSLGINYNLK